ncbi:lysophospholipid acyltransferase 7-like [Argonauta hians]
MSMPLDDIVYVTLLLLSIPFGHVVKVTRSAVGKQALTGLVGAAMALLICRLHIIHSLVTTSVNCLIVKLLPQKYCHIVSLFWCFTYLAFFRTASWFGLPAPPAFANAVQLFLTLRMIGLAFEIHDTKYPPRQEESNNKLLKLYQDIDPGVTDIFSYAYCYMGLLAGPYMKYRTYYDMLHEPDTEDIETVKPMLRRLSLIPIIALGYFTMSHFFSIKYVKTDAFYERPLWFRLFYMMPIFCVFRWRLYIAWILAECSCMMGAYGAYPAESLPKCGQGPSDLKALHKLKSVPKKSASYNFEAVNNLYIWGCELAPTTKEALRSWNKSVQYWLANIVYRRVPVKSFRVFLTMAVSAYWHGVDPGYYMSFLTVPPILMAERVMIAAFRDEKPSLKQRLFDHVCWFFRMRGFDYNCMGFLLLSWHDTVRYWSSIYFIGHITIIVFFIVGTIFRPPRKKTND